jgi:hypothetical protein
MYSGRWLPDARAQLSSGGCCGTAGPRGLARSGGRGGRTLGRLGARGRGVGGAGRGVGDGPRSRGPRKGEGGAGPSGGGEGEKGAGVGRPNGPRKGGEADSLFSFSII